MSEHSHIEKDRTAMLGPRHSGPIKRLAVWSTRDGGNLLHSRAYESPNDPAHLAAMEALLLGWTIEQVQWFYSVEGWEARQRCRS